MCMRVVALLVAALSGYSILQCSAQDLDHCYSCEGVCGAALDVDACRCDGQCEIYGDCCGTPPCSDASLLHTPAGGGDQLPTFQCRSVFVVGSQVRGQGVEKAFWMVENCPPDWAGTVHERDCQDVGNFYPVTDTNTGLVYSNEHCAVCNSVTSLVHWKASLVCSDTLLQLATQPNFTLTLDILTANCQPCSYVAPASFALTSSGLPAPPPRPCYLNTASCPSREASHFIFQSWTEEEYNELVVNCTRGPYSLVREFFLNYRELFRNQYCAMCNGINMDNLVCARNENQLDNCTYDSATPSPSPPAYTYYSSGAPPAGYIYISEDDEGSSFSLVLDIFGDGLVVVDSETVTQFVAVICPEGEVFDPVLNDCRQTVCPEGFTLIDSTCQLSASINGTACPGGLIVLNSSDFLIVDNDTVLFNGSEYDVLQRDALGRPVVCPSIPSCPAYIALTVEDNYVYIDNDTVLYNGEQHRIAFIDDSGQPVICSNFSVNGTQEVNVTVLTYSYPGGFVELTYIGCSLSVLGCTMILVTYSVFKELRTVPSKILMNLSAAILVSNLFILLSELGSDSQDFCIATAIILHLFFLAQFSWMSIMIFELGRTLNQARKLVPESSQAYKTKLLLVYTVTGWSIPVIIVSVSTAVNFTTDNLVLYGETESGREGSCWINHLESALVSFVAPAAISVFFNVIVFTFVSVLLYKSWRAQSKLNKDQNTPFLRIYLAVASITGLTWVFGFLAILAGVSWSWYPFIVLNSSQGFLIFLGFILTKNVLKRYLALLSCGRTEEASVPSSKLTIMKSRSKTGTSMELHQSRYTSKLDNATLENGTG